MLKLTPLVFAFLSAALAFACAGRSALPAAENHFYPSQMQPSEVSRQELQRRIAPTLASSAAPDPKGITLALSAAAAGDGDWRVRGSGDFRRPYDGQAYFELYPQMDLHPRNVVWELSRPCFWDLPTPPRIIRAEIREDTDRTQRIAKEVSFAAPIPAGSLVALSYRGETDSFASILVIPPVVEADRGFVVQIPEPPLESREGELTLTCRANQRSEYSVIALDRGRERTLLTGYRSYFAGFNPWENYIHLKVCFPADLSDDARIRVISHYLEKAVEIPLIQIRQNHAGRWIERMRPFRSSGGRIVFPKVGVDD